MPRKKTAAQLRRDRISPELNARGEAAGRRIRKKYGANYGKGITTKVISKKQLLAQRERRRKELAEEKKQRSKLGQTNMSR